MRRASILGLALCLIAVVPRPATARAALVQEAAAPVARIEAYVKAWQAIATLRDRFHQEASQPQNKKAEALDALRAQLRSDVARVLEENGLTEQEYDHLTFLISTDASVRRTFDRLMGNTTAADSATTSDSTSASRAGGGGGAAAAAAQGEGERAPARSPHIDHIMTSFPATPNADGLLPTAMNEARAAAQHAALAARDPANLDAMRTHAGHVRHALAPTENERGPGTGYGLKNAVQTIATHIERAAAGDGAPQAVTTHAGHVAAAARAVADRVDAMLALIDEIRAATSAEAAAERVTRLDALAKQLTTGHDANGDGRIGWDRNEGGLQHVEQHMQLLVQAGARR